MITMEFTLYTIGLFMLALWFIYSFYRTYRQATTIEKITMVRRLVHLAEEAFIEPKSGPERFAYVLDKLVQFYPTEDRTQLKRWIEAAVERMKEQAQRKES